MRKRVLIVLGAAVLTLSMVAPLTANAGPGSSLSKDNAEALAFYRTVSDVRLTYVSPAAQIAPGARTGRFRTGRDELLTDDRGQSRITIGDYAAAVLDELEHPQAIGRRMTVAY